MHVVVEGCAESCYRLVIAIVCGVMRNTGLAGLSGGMEGKRERNELAAAGRPSDGHRRRHGNGPDLPPRGGPATVRRVPAGRQPGGAVAADGVLRRVRG